MKALLTILATLLLSFVGVTQSSASTLPPCEHEDSINCYWDAETMGNGTGSSFENINGVINYTTPIEAHTCAEGAILVDGRNCVFPVKGIWEPTQTTDPNPTELGYVQASDGAYVSTDYATQYESIVAPVDTTETTAWQLWDATGASSLLPDSATTVTYLSHNTVGFPLTADTIIVWDNFGNFYQFQLS